MPFLHVVNGPEAGTRYELTKPDYVLGRHPDCDIVIDVGAVSRHHCKLYKQNSGCYVEDLKSRNGTFVNDKPIEGPHRMADGDQIQVCDVVFAFQEELPPSNSVGDSSYRAVMIEDEGITSSAGSTITSTMDVVAGKSGVQLTATPEAKLNALIEITQSLGKALSLDKVLPQVLDSLFRIFVHADRGFIGLVNANGVLVPRWTKLRREDRDETIRISRTIANQVMKTKEAILSADAASDSRFDMSQSVAEFRIRSVMCAPLLDSEGRAIGLLQLDTVDQRQKFQEEDLELLVSAASQASIAIDNAQLHEESLRRSSLQRDLQLAHEVQHAFLPQIAPDVDGYDFYDYYQAANQVGGDYYDYLNLADGRLAILVADVVGHGVAAAMLMAKLSAEARFCLANDPNPARAVTALNQRLCALRLNRFITLVVCVLNPKTHDVDIVRAGHLPPISRSAEGRIEEPGELQAGVPLGIIEGAEYEGGSVQLKPGESLTLYTDGIIEAADGEGKQYGTARMKEKIAASDGSPQQIGAPLLDEVRQHLGQQTQEDDMCLVCFRRR